jgi:hypothetical protein
MILIEHEAVWILFPEGFGKKMVPKKAFFYGRGTRKIE